VILEHTVQPVEVLDSWDILERKDLPVELSDNWVFLEHKRMALVALELVQAAPESEQVVLESPEGQDFLEQSDSQHLLERK
jgi:hypothetical protein